jgi:5'-3' exonuclease
MKPNIIFIDGHYFLHRVLHVPDIVSMRTSEGVAVGGVYGIIVSVKKALENFPTAQRCVLVWDTGRPKRRTDLFPEYKANRAPKTEEEAEEKRLYKELFDHQQEILFRGLHKLGVRQMLLENYEGDDLLAWAARTYGPEGLPILLVSEDKDLLQLVRPNVGMWMPSKEKLVTEDNFFEEVEIDPRLYLMYKALLGDPSDNIPGIHLVGKTTVKAVVSTAKHMIMGAEGDLKDKYMEILTEACEAQPVTRSSKKLPAKVVRILDNLDIFERNLEIMDLALEDPDEGEACCLHTMVEGGTCTFQQTEAISWLGGMEFASILDGFSYLHQAFGALR